MRGRGVLLHDEDAGADAADRELLVALGLDVLAGDRAAPLQKRRQRVDRGLGPLGVQLEGAVLAVAHPAEHAELARPVHDRLARVRAVGAQDGADRRAGRHRRYEPNSKRTNAVWFLPSQRTSVSSLPAFASRHV